MQYIIKCKKCGKEFNIDCSENNYKKERYSHFCSISCRNSHIISQETKNKISLSLQKNTLKKQKKCVCCGISFFPNGKEKFCSDNCKHLYKVLPTLVKYFGFDNFTIGTQKIYTEIEKVKSLLYNDYWINELTSTQIAEKFKYPSPCNLTGKIFKYLNIPSRTLKQQNLLSALTRKNSNHLIVSPYKQGWHTTWDGKKVFLRSSYESDYAKDLDKDKVKYEVESLKIKYWNTQKNEYHCAIPDFYLPDTNTIVEIKSNYTLDIQEMKDKVIAYKDQGYNFRLILEHKEIDIFNYIM